MKLAIMQSYFFPYIGYFQLMNAVDEFVVYDNIEFTKKGWINRNRILVNGEDTFITLPLKKDSDYLKVKDRFLADTWPQDRLKMLNRMRESYKKAPQFERVFPMIETSLKFEEKNLFKFIFHSIEQIKNFLNIDSKLIVSSTLSVDHELKAEQKVIAICKKQNADTYINPIGGLALYDRINFTDNGIDLKFIQSKSIEYPQLGLKFVPWLSIIDVLMFNEIEMVNGYLNHCEFL